jgi:hypothetical protein
MVGRTCLGLAAAAAVVASCAVDPRDPSWPQISTSIIAPSCGTAGCHSALAGTAGIVLDSADAGYASLVDPPDGLGPFVVAGDLESPLLYLLRGDEVGRMPPDGPLPDADIALIEAWILAGAAR